MESLKEHKIDECKTIINSLIELHMMNFIDDQSFYSDLKKYMDQLELLNKEQVVVDEEAMTPKEEETSPTQVDKIIKSLQCQLLATKAENVLTFKKLVKESNSHIIEEQTEHIEKRDEFVNNVIVPLKAIFNKLYEECAELE